MLLAAGSYLPCNFCHLAKYGNTDEWISCMVAKDEEELAAAVVVVVVIINSLIFPRGKLGVGPAVSPFLLSL